MTLLKGTHHDHIDGSRAVSDIIDDLYRLAGKDFPFPSVEAWLAFFQNPQEDIVKRFNTVTSVLQSTEALELLGYAYGRRRAAEGLKYVEAKFAPQYHVFGGLAMAAVAKAMISGLRRAECASSIRILPVICIGREADPATGVKIARIALEYDGEAALDLVCDEANHPPEKHLPAFKLTQGTKVRRDCHAGEWVAKEPAATYRERLVRNIRTALYDLRVDGIGQAIPLADEPELIKFIVGNGIRVAGCPLSNKYCGLLSDVRELRIGELLDQGVIYTLNADDDLFMASLPEVAAVCDAAYGFTPEQQRQLEENVFRGAFAADIRR
ncbi:MAG: hypothetical protein WCT10_03055 [Patescibacteria group bacterium]|jgi:adenosine deaminase